MVFANGAVSDGRQYLCRYVACIPDFKEQRQVFDLRLFVDSQSFCALHDGLGTSLIHFASYSITISAQIKRDLRSVEQRVVQRSAMFVKKKGGCIPGSTDREGISTCLPVVVINLHPVLSAASRCCERRLPCRECAFAACVPRAIDLTIQIIRIS